jgi:hypothetical protein
MEKAVKQKQKQKMYFPIIYFWSVVEKRLLELLCMCYILFRIYISQKIGLSD